MIGDVFNDTNNFADFIGALAETFDFLRGFLDVFTNDDHTFNRLTNGALTTIGVTQGFLSCFSTELSIASHVLNEDSQRFDGFGRLRNLSHLGFRCLGEFIGAINDAASRVSDLHSCCLDASDDLGELFDHIVKRVGQNAEGVWCYFSLDAQVAITNGANFLEQFLDLRL